MVILSHYLNTGMFYHNVSYNLINKCCDRRTSFAA